MTSLPEVLRELLSGPLPGPEAQVRMAPRHRSGQDPVWDAGELRQAAGLLLLYPHRGRWHVPLTVRGAGLRHHTGQVSLPGGRVDPGETVEQAALREADEELGIPLREVEILGRLTPLPVFVSRHLLHPVVGVAHRRPDFRLAAREVERLIELPLARLRQPDATGCEERVSLRPPHGTVDVPYFAVQEARVWGATAMVLAEFLAVVGDLEV